jgi:hypothetical protein
LTIGQASGNVNWQLKGNHHMTEPKHKTIAAALASAQSQMGKALKDANNPHFKSKYADLSSVTSACMPALNANGIAVIQPFVDDETGRYVKTVLIHESGETLECRVPLIVQKNDMQGFGSAATYARRYGLMAMAGIAPEDDDGNAAVVAAPRNEPRQKAPVVAIDNAVAYLAEASDLDDLRRIWGNLPKDVQAVQAVIDAKDARKAALDKPVTRPSDSVDQDQIPY